MYVGMDVKPTGIRDERFEGSSAWRGDDFPDTSAWTLELSGETLTELDASLRRVLREGKTLSDLQREDFEAPSFAAQADALRYELHHGRGFILLRGFPIDSYSVEEACILYWGIASHLGQPIRQNRAGDFVFHVRDEGYNFEKQYGTIGVRVSRTADAIDFHTDSSAAYAGYCPDIVGLLAVQSAKSGGETGIASVYTLHNIIREEHPEYLRRLYQPYYFDRRAELREGESPVRVAPVFSYDGALSARYFRFNLERGFETAGIPLTIADTDAINFMESCCHRPGVAVRFDMQRGDIQFVNNNFVFHSRTAFEDYEEPERRRHMLRFWLRYS